MRAHIALALALLAAASPAFADGKLPWRKDPKDIKLARGPVERTTPHVGAISNVIYLERCKGGCTIRKGANDARAYTSTIPDGQGEFQIGEFQNAAGDTGPDADTEWNMLVKCVQEVYSPFNVQVTDVKPPASVVTYHMDIVAGLPSDVNLPNSIGGVSPGGAACNGADNWITYSFANLWNGTPVTRTWTLCGVVAQESAHAFGLDHAWSHSDGTSSCNDPMTYRNDCGGQQFFRNDQMTCGEYQGRACMCGGLQNAHQRLINVFGPGTPITSPPTVTLNLPAAGTTTVTSGAAFSVTAFAQRGIKAVELWVNGYKWGQALAAKWGVNGQPESTYTIALPSGVPDGVMDVVLKAKDDIDVTTEATITVTKGAPCADASACAAGQKCEAGKCFWEPAAGVLGDECTFDQFCVSGVCAGTSDDKKFCTRECVVDSTASCEEGFRCEEGSTLGKGFCIPGSADEGGGGCATSEDATPSAALLLGLFGLGLVVVRRRR